MARRFIAFPFLALTALCMNGCLSHWFIETESRLQVENATENYTLYGVDVLGEDNIHYEKWIKETLLPGERSYVAEADWVGEFRIRTRYGKDGADTLEKVKKMEIPGGSLFLKITSEDDTLVYTFK